MNDTSLCVMFRRIFWVPISLLVGLNEYSDLQEVGEKIVDKCKGLPLAIKSMGDLLRGKHNKEEWENSLNNDTWGLYERRNINVLPALWLSYYYLPSQLKQCFAYCSLFPKDYMFTQKEIIFLWMAEGLLHSKKEKGIEEVGEEYFQELISKSFFQPSSENKSTFLMHELIHELAMFVSGEFCSVLNENKLSHKVRHLSYMRDCGGIFYSKEFEEELSQAKCLRTFLLKLQWIELDQVWLSIIEQLHEAFPRLRVLSIANHYMNKLPDSIGSLKYLRYLELECCEMKKIPDTICNLYNLETLILSECGQVTRLPTNIGNLFKLQHLHIPPYLEEMPLQISKMKNLQTLNRFVVGENEFVITLLEGLQDLRGTLRLFGLENVDSVEDVLEAKLKNKKFLSQLHLFWAKTHKPHDSEREKEILSALEPHASLKAFTIRGYRG
ncbi:putative disease resistance RPP13-like protein 1 isoform X1 [Humulus lupulus]|uniref:putative disease resistance RPP13-like protein 1 isoform X1 n=1 Tax=Humulus lupulus TaxID=3486 RepID=UPI002B410AE7|nr:putative disease resistance RPP13-like protein 1 isoform X1 [Humulus lupulus]